MKNTILTFAIAMGCCLPSMAQKPFKMQGTVDAGLRDAKYLIYVADANYKIPGEATDSVEVKNGKFNWTTKVADVRPFILRAKYSDNAVSKDYFQEMIVPGETLKINIKAGEDVVDGSTFYKQWAGADAAMTKHVKKIQEWSAGLESLKEPESEDDKAKLIEKLRAEYTELMTAMREETQTYLEQHGNEDGCIAFNFMQHGDLEACYKAASDAVKNGRLKNFLNSVLAQEKAQKEEEARREAEAKVAQDKSGEGKMFIDFEAEYNGKVTKLSDYVGKGKYVLVDFWASWCGPCKAEIPNLINVYNKYKGDKFEVLGVATWDKPKDTEKAIQQLNIPYPQMMNAQQAGSDAYGIQGIPQIILFGPDGTILKRDLRGEAVEEAVKKYLEQK